MQYIMDLASQNKSINAKTTNGSSATAQTSSVQATSGAIARLPKAEDRFQEVTEERSFTARLMESWSQTFFSAITLGFQSSDFIDLLKDALRPLVVPQETSDGTDSSTDSTPSSGDGIEDATPADSNSNDGSII